MRWKPFRDARTRSAWRDTLLRSQGDLCAICGYRFALADELSSDLQLEYSPTFDHVVPRSQGGSDELSNFRLVHYACNRARGDGNVSKPQPPIPRILRMT